MSSLVGYVLQVSLILLIFGGIAAGLVRFGRRAGPRSAGPLELVARLHLEGRRVVYLVRAGSRYLVVGGSEAGLTRLGDLEASALGDGGVFTDATALTDESTDARHSRITDTLEL